MLLKLVARHHHSVLLLSIVSQYDEPVLASSKLRFHVSHPDGLISFVIKSLQILLLTHLLRGGPSANARAKEE